MNSKERPMSLVELSHCYAREIEGCKNFEERMHVTITLFKNLESYGLANYSNNSTLGFNREVFRITNSLFAGKKLLICGASLSEVQAYSKICEQVYFLSLPPLKGYFPDNSQPLHYDNKFRIQVPPSFSGVDCVFSHHVVEHIHHKDIKQHLKEIHTLLKKGGEYYIIAPHKFAILKGPIEDYNNHIGRYTYNFFADTAKHIGFCVYKPIINPFLLNVFIPYKKSLLERFIMKAPTMVLSVLGYNSLFIRLVK